MNDTTFFLALKLVASVYADAKASEAAKKLAEDVWSDVEEYAWKHFPQACCA